MSTIASSDFWSPGVLVERKPRVSSSLNRIAVAAAIVIMLTSSFDIFLVVNAGGNFRLCQILAPILLVIAGLRFGAGARAPALGVVPLCVWLAFQILFIPASDFWPKSFGYCLWLLLNIATVFSFVQLFSDNLRSLITILRWYAYSFGVIAIFGFVQFTLPLLGYGGMFVTEWWIPNRLARVNGFTYEPSYFATYLVIGLVFIGSLRRAKSRLLPSGVLSALYWLAAGGIVISSSRIGIAFMFLDISLAYFGPWLLFLRNLSEMRIVKKTLRALIPSLVWMALIGALAIGAAGVMERNPTTVLMFLAGTGIADTTAHSVTQREGSLQDTLIVFLRNPFIGKTLGGVSSAIAELHGETVESFEASKPFEGMNVFAEALAASGIIGIIPFLWFLVVTIRKPLRLVRLSTPFYSVLLRALVRSLVFGWAILQFNQNMLRPYLWVHIAILVTVYGAALQSARTQATPEPQV
jgi:hypothetical protein